MRIIGIVWIFFVFNSGLNGQITYSMLSFGDTLSNNRGSASVIDADLNAYFVGTTSTGLAASDDVALYKFAPTGDILWNYKYGTEDNEFVNNMIFSEDQFLIICGDVHDAESSDLNGFIMKIDTLGNLIWYNTYGTDSATDDFYGITLLQNGNIAITGFTSSETGTGNDVLLVKYSPEGILLDEFVFGAPVNDIGMGIAETVDGDLIISGDRATAGLFYNAFIARINEANEIVWDHFIDLPVNSGCKTLRKTYSGNFILCGESATEISPQFDILIATFDDAGNIILLNTIPGIGVEAAYDITEPEDGKYFVTGYGYNVATDNNDIIVIYTDSELNEIDRKYYGSAGADLGYDIQSDQDGSFWVSGFTTSGAHVLFTLIYDVFDISNTAEGIGLTTNIKIYPNPVSDHIIIETKVKIDKLELLDINGRTLFSLINFSGEEKLYIPLDVESGIFMLKIYSGEESIVKKIIAG